MAHTFTQELFELKPLIKSIDIKLCTQSRNGVKQILALVTTTNEIVLYYCYGELPPVLKRIPWIGDSSKDIQAICFDSTATWLLIVCLDSSLYIIPALYIVDKKQKIDCKWSLTDLTHFPKISPLPNFLPTCCVWWQTLECNQNALVGFDCGNIVLVSLTDGRVLGGCTIPEPVKKLHLCIDNIKEVVSLLVTGETERQWRLILEHHSNGYTWPSDNTNPQSEESVRSRFYTLKQMGVDKLVSLRQRLGARKDSQSDTTSESSCSETQSALALYDHSDSVQGVQSVKTSASNLYPASELELMPQMADTLFTSQSCKNRNIFTALYRTTGLLTVHASDLDTAPISVYRLLPHTSSLVLTDNLIYSLNDLNTVSVISCQLSESRLEGETEFNEDALVAQFSIANEKILDLYKIIDMSVDSVPQKMFPKNKFSHNKHRSDLSFFKPAIDTCLVVTDKSIYRLYIRNPPVQRFIEYVTEENDMEKAEKLSYIFNLSLQQLLEHCGDLLVSRGSYHSGIILYKQAKVHLLKRVLKLAVSADCRTLLKFVHLCLSASKIDMNITTRIHIGNVAVMAYVELLLRSNTNEHIKNSNTKDFMNFLVHESHFDPILAVNMACQAGHWNVVNLLSKSRGLQAEVVVAFGKILQNDFITKPSSLDFLYALSEPTLTQSFLILPQSAQIIYQYIRENGDTFPTDILKRLVLQLDPSQPCVAPFLRMIYANNKSHSTNGSNFDSIDFETSDLCSIIVKDLVETFLCIVTSLITRTRKLSFDLSLLETVVPETRRDKCDVISKLPDLKLLSCGYEHAAVIRNNSVYTMGVATSGCLGVGPMLTSTSGPRLVTTLHDLKVTPLSVSCGRKHTLCATDSGVFAWGSNVYGQLGLGPHLQETPYPQLLTTISQLKIVDIASGQYHSIALTHTGKVYTWGWGIHGQLGHGGCDNEYYPRLVKFDSPVKQVSAGHAHSLVLTCDGKVYGFGSNVFGQLENCHIESKKSTRPTWVIIMPDMYVPIEKIATAYFHNMAVTSEHRVFMWGASPEEVRCFQQRNNSQKQNGGGVVTAGESWKSSVQMYQSQTKRTIKQIAVGYRHCAILDQGRIYWGKNKDDELSQPNLKDPYEGVMGHRFTHVACGLDYTMAIDHTGQLLAWGTPAMIETILGVSMNFMRKKQEDHVIMVKGTKRAFRTTYNHPISNNLPIEISVLPGLTFTYNQVNHKVLLSNRHRSYFLMEAEENDMDKLLKVKKVYKQDFKSIYNVPDVNIGQRTLHHAIQAFLELYDGDNVIKRSTDADDYQTASKVSYLHGHFVDSLGFSVEAFKRHIAKMDIDLASLFTCKDSYDLKEKDQGVELIVKCLKPDEKNSNCSSPARILSSSSSLDSLRQFGEEGGLESPCESDIHQNIANYVQSVKKSDQNAPRLAESYKDLLAEKRATEQRIEIKNKKAKEVLDLASRIVDFYIKKVYQSENHILMQNILLKSIEFWLYHNLPVPVLEDILLKNLDKYFYPLSILLFCKNFEEDDMEIKKNEDVRSPLNSSVFLKEFSTKFCLHLCSMVLENAEKS